MSAAPDRAPAAPLPGVSIQELANRLARVERVMGIVRLAQPPITNLDLGRLRVGAIVEAVAHEMGVSPMRICSADRSQPAFRARAASCWLAKRLTAHSLAMIGAVIQRDHSTVINAIRQAEAMRASDPAFRMVTDKLLRQFTPEPDEKQGITKDQADRLRDWLERMSACGNLRLTGDPE